MTETLYQNKADVVDAAYGMKMGADMKKSVELLAPAGDMESLHAAVENGADAVYLGGKLFNARQQAGNFDIAELQEGLRYAHARGVSIYLTLNTLLRDDEIPQALDYAGEVCNAGIDGIIVQDLGLAALLRRTFPDLPLHGSTQMTVYDLEGVRLLEEMGFQRVVLARELTLEQAAWIARNTELEVEMFVHGAMCVCYSGQCLMSSMIGGRSGNRGRCAQPCRLAYTLVSSDGKNRQSDQQRYLLSPKDMNTLEYIAEIAASGIRSLKIEGRMKSPEYVATVVRIYRKYLDTGLEQVEKGAASKLSIDEKDRKDLLQIFNRGGFSPGYLKGKTGADMMSYEKPNNSGICIGSTISYDRRRKTVRIRLEDDLSIGDGIEIWTGGSDSPGGTVSLLKKDGRNVKKAAKGDSVEAGFFSGRIAPGMKVYKTTDAELIREARRTFSDGNMKRILIRGAAVLEKGHPLVLTVDDDKGHRIVFSGSVHAETAVNRPLTRERLTAQLKRTGSTPFTFIRLDVDMQDGLTIPISEINDVRRKALEALYEARADRYPDRYCNNTGMGDGNVVDAHIGGQYKSNQNSLDDRSVLKTRRPLISLYFYRWDEKHDLAGLGADRLYMPLSALWRPGFRHAAEAAANAGAEVFCWLPPVARGNYEKLIDRFIAEYNSRGTIDGVLAANTGTVRKLAGIDGLKVAGDISLNLFNSHSVAKAAELGLESAAVSVELTLRQISGLTENLKQVSENVQAYEQRRLGAIKLEAAVYGRLPLMISEYCPPGCIEGGFASSSKCTGCCGSGEYSLRDRLGMEFPVLCDNIDCRSTILNSNVLFVPDALSSLADAGIDIFRLYIWDEDTDTIKELVRLYRAALAAPDTGEKAASGRLAEKIKASGFTKGHYYRGV